MITHVTNQEQYVTRLLCKEEAEEEERRKREGGGVELWFGSGQDFRRGRHQWAKISVHMQ